MKIKMESHEEHRSFQATPDAIEAAAQMGFAMGTDGIPEIECDECDGADDNEGRSAYRKLPDGSLEVREQANKEAVS